MSSILLLLFLSHTAPTTGPIAAPQPMSALGASAAPQKRSRHRRRHHAKPDARRSAPTITAPAPTTTPAPTPAPAPSAAVQGPAAVTSGPTAAPIPTEAAAADQLAQAEARYRTALATTPGMAAYHESLALVLEREGRLEEALASHEQAVHLDSIAFRNREGYGMLLLKLGRSAAAIPQLGAASRIDRGSVEVRKALASALLDQGRREDALVALREARQIDSSDSDIQRSLKQAEATAPGKDRLNDATATEDYPIGRTIRRALEWIFGAVLGVASLALLLPMLGGVVAALVRLPRSRARTEVAA